MISVNEARRLTTIGLTYDLQKIVEDSITMAAHLGEYEIDVVVKDKNALWTVCAELEEAGYQYTVNHGFPITLRIMW